MTSTLGVIVPAKRDFRQLGGELAANAALREFPKCAPKRADLRISIISLNSYHFPMAITYQFWVTNLIQGARDIADEETQRRRWLAQDAYAWERPAELLSVVVDDMHLELFIEDNRARFSEAQLRTAKEFAQALLDFDCGPDGWRDPNDVLRDPLWEGIRVKARAFVSAFERELG